MPDFSLNFDFKPYGLTGVVVGTLMNHAGALAALGDSVGYPPYKAAPKGPILYVKPRNTLSLCGAAVCAPASPGELEIGASLGLVVGRTACRVAEPEALAYLAGYTLVADLSVPHASFYRPSIRFKALDGSCLVGPLVVPCAALGSADEVAIRVSLDGAQLQATSTSGMIRSAARLLADVSDFMTLHAGDILMLGVALGAPRARAGQRFAIDAEGIGRLEGRVVGHDARAFA